MLQNLFKPLRLPLRTSLGLVPLRLIVGLAFMYHGHGKIQNPFHWADEMGFPSVLQGLAAIAEFGGGLAWVLGFITPVASFLLMCTMIGATLFHVRSGAAFVSMGGPSYELAACYLAIAILLLLTGPGKFSGDALVFGEK